MNAPARPLAAFLGDATLHAVYLARAREIEAFNAALLAQQAPDTAAPSGAESTRTTGRSGTVLGAAAMPSLEAIARSGGSAPALSSPARVSAAASVAASPVASQRPRGLWLPEECEADDFFPLQLGLPGALAELLGDFALAMPPQRQPGFAHQVIDAITPGADLARVAPAFVAWMFDDAATGALRFELQPPLRSAAEAVARLHRLESQGAAPARTEWAAARAAVRAVADAPADDDIRVKLFAADAAWSCAGSRSVAAQAFRIWQWSLGSLPVHHALGYSGADFAEFNRLRDAFWTDTAELRARMLAAGEPRAAYEAHFAARHPEAAQRNQIYAARSRQATLAMSVIAGDRLLALLRRPPGDRSGE